MGQKSEAQLRQLYRKVFDSPEGAEVLSHLRAICFGDSRTFVPGDPCATAFNEGRRSVLLDVLARLKDPIEKQEVAIDE